MINPRFGRMLTDKEEAQRERAKKLKEKRKKEYGIDMTFEQALHSIELTDVRKEFEDKVEKATTAEELETLDNEVSEKISHHIHRGDKDREYRCYHEAEKHDSYQEMFEEISEKIYHKKKSL